MINAFSVIEVLIILGVISVLSILGIMSINSLRITIDLENLKSSIDQSISYVRNNSRNSVKRDNSTASNWVLGIQEGQLNYYVCNISNTQSSCEIVRRADYNSSLKVDFSQGCKGIGFTSTQSQAFKVNNLPFGNLDYTGFCEIHVTDGENLVSKLVINLNDKIFTWI
ncbi:hypothetical protein D6810_00090 [Candidatus Dojkabacteria bacterium]|uniref:Uncharacterized protein n=1 Tax=Candidatus Dojkabacteria bacterium TaxID=2099670 RepID=A0A3M0Z145_9BACT|nr:MAG: hypothetical protein D6810_00090 [Candidatus Dojkabacteria bacterium]